MNTTEVWNLNQGIARLSTGERSARIRLDRLGDGLSVARHAESPDADRLLGVQIPGLIDPIESATLIDQYVRQNDLIATYEMQSPEHLRVQLDWRYRWEESGGDVQVAGRGEGIQLNLSLQTNRLDLQPTVVVISEFAAAEVLMLRSPDDKQLSPFQPSEPSASWLAAPVWLAPQHDQQHSIVLMVLPDDLRRAEVAVNGSRVRIAFHLLDEHLEKGVIRRAQVAAWRVPLESDRYWARRLFWQLNEGPPPLTT